MILIGFGHRARQGKNTAAQAVLEAQPLDCDVRMYAFADALKKEVRVASARYKGQWNLIETWKEAGLIPEWVHYEEPKPRTLLQWWGTEYRRKQDPLYWVKRLDKKLLEHNPDVALITDIRFLNEVEFIRQRGGVVIECVRVGAPDFEVEEHQSERELDGFKWDYTITAETAEECRRKAVDVYKAIYRG